jgi:hypothetical protein
MFDSAPTPATCWSYFPRMMSKRNTSSVAARPVHAADHIGSAIVELHLGDYNVNGASIGCGRAGTTFAFTRYCAETRL